MNGGPVRPWGADKGPGESPGLLSRLDFSFLLCYDSIVPFIGLYVPPAPLCFPLEWGRPRTSFRVSIPTFFVPKR